MLKFEAFIQMICWVSFSIHFGLIAQDFFTKEMTSTNVNTEKLTLKNFPIIIKICIDPAFDEENYAYDNPKEFIVNVKNMKNSDGEKFYLFLIELRISN